LLGNNKLPSKVVVGGEVMNSKLVYPEPSDL